MNAIKENRIKTGLSGRKVAEILDVPYRTWNKWENGERYPPCYVEKMIIKELESIAQDKPGQ